MQGPFGNDLPKTYKLSVYGDVVEAKAPQKTISSMGWAHRIQKLQRRRRLRFLRLGTSEEHLGNSFTVLFLWKLSWILVWSFEAPSGGNPLNQKCCVSFESTRKPAKSQPLAMGLFCISKNGHLQTTHRRKKYQQSS